MSDESQQKGPGFSKYLARLLIFGIPVINVVAAVLWGFAGKDEETRDFGRAALMVIMVFAVIALISGIAAFTFLSTRLFELLP